jgi:hypothetical protein
MTGMTKSEREDLQRLVRQRERVLKSAAKQRSKDLLAEFENQMGQEYAFDQDVVWQKAVEVANRDVRRMQKQIAARCKEMGIPERFAPSISLSWHHRGHDNLLAARRRELRIMAESRVEAIEAKVITDIELSCLMAQEQIAGGCGPQGGHKGRPRAEILAEREGAFNNAIGALWLAYIGGAIGFNDAEQLDAALKQAAAGRLPLPVPKWARLTGEMQH